LHIGSDGPHRAVGHPNIWRKVLHHIVASPNLARKRNNSASDGKNFITWGGLDRDTAMAWAIHTQGSIKASNHLALNWHYKSSRNYRRKKYNLKNN
jgi:hypothetical protein